MAALRASGWEVVELRDGWYEDDRGGGIAISGQGKYWEIRDTPFTVKEAVGPGGGIRIRRTPAPTSSTFAARSSGSSAAERNRGRSQSAADAPIYRNCRTLSWRAAG